MQIFYIIILIYSSYLQHFATLVHHDKTSKMNRLSKEKRWTQCKYLIWIHSYVLFCLVFAINFWYVVNISSNGNDLHCNLILSLIQISSHYNCQLDLSDSGSNKQAPPVEIWLHTVIHCTLKQGSREGGPDSNSGPPCALLYQQVWLNVYVPAQED